MTKKDIETTIAGLEAKQRHGREMARQGEAIVQQAEGALALARHWLGRLQRAEDEAGPATAGANGPAE